MDHLTAEQIEELRSDLELARVETTKQIEALTTAAKPVDLNEPIGRLSRMDALQQHGLAQKQQAEAKAKLLRIDAALKRIEAGTFGICIKTGEPIPFARLKAMPENAVGAFTSCKH